MSSGDLSVLIVDDEAPARARLERLVDELDGFRVAGSCATGAEALQLAGSLKPAVALLDIRMPAMSGIEAARHMNRMQKPPAVVFTTAYDQYALEAFDAQAIGYLLKPVRRERLEAALRHAARLAEPELKQLGAAAARVHIAVRSRDDVKLVPVKDIAYFRADQKYVTVRHKGGEDLIEESLTSLAEEFAERFVRIHRSVLVAVAHTAALERAPDGGHRVRLRGLDDALPVSRRQLTELKSRLGAGR